MVAYTSHGIYVEQLVSPAHAVINPCQNRFVNSKTMVFPCDGQFGNETAIYSKKFKEQQKAILVDVGEDQQDIVAFRPTPAAIGDRVVLVPINADPNYVICLTDMSFFKNGSFDEVDSSIPAWTQNGWSVTAPLWWQSEKWDPGSPYPHGDASIFRTNQYVYPGCGNYSLGIWTRRNTALGSGFYVMATQTGPLKKLRYLSFIMRSGVSSCLTAGIPHRFTGCYLYAHGEWRLMFSTFRDIFQVTRTTFPATTWWYVEIDMLTSLALELQGADDTSPMWTLAREYLSGTGKFAFGVRNYYETGCAAASWEANFQSIRATR
jgi:hypothetical protein